MINHEVMSDASNTRELFHHLGLPCLIRTNQWGAWCGYVAVPPEHPWYGKSWGDIDADVHGGGTYAETCNDIVCHVAVTGEPDNVWWIGFDCAHAGDLVPGLPHMPDDVYRDRGYVVSQVERLASQAVTAATMASA